MEFTERVRAYSKEELEALLGEAGLALKEVFGDYELGSFDEADSPRLVMVAASAKND